MFLDRKSILLLYERMARYMFAISEYSIVGLVIGALVAEHAVLGTTITIVLGVALSVAFFCMGFIFTLIIKNKSL